jgi:hypothetical protein
MKCRNCFSGFFVNAGYTWTPWSAEGIIFYIWNDLKCEIMQVTKYHIFWYKFGQVVKSEEKKKNPEMYGTVFNWKEKFTFMLCLNV